MSVRHTENQVFHRKRSYGTFDFLIRLMITVAICMLAKYIYIWHDENIQFQLMKVDDDHAVLDSLNSIGVHAVHPSMFLCMKE